MRRNLFPRELKTAFIYTMGIPADPISEQMKPMENFISLIFRRTIETLYSQANYTFIDDYSNYEASDLSEMKKRREEVFPIECEKAFRFGAELVSEQN